MTTATNTHTATAEDIASIAQLVANIRIDWPAGVTRLVLEAHASQVDAADLAVAAIRAAQNLDYRTPKTIGWRGPHWAGANTLPQEIRRLHYCAICGKREDACETQRFGDDDHAFEPTDRPVRERAR